MSYSYHPTVSSHVSGGHDFPDTSEPAIVNSYNLGWDKEKPGQANPFVVLSPRQFKVMYHEPGWDNPYKDESSHAFEFPEKAEFGHSESPTAHL